MTGAKFGAGITKQRTIYGQGFGAGAGSGTGTHAKQSAVSPTSSNHTGPQNKFLSSDGFGMTGLQQPAGGGVEMYIGDPSLKKMKEEIGMKESQNIELKDEVKRLKYMLTKNVSKDDAS